MNKRSAISNHNINTRPGGQSGTLSPLSPRPISWTRITNPLPVRDTSLTWNAGGEGNNLLHMKTTKQIIDEYTDKHGAGLVPDAGTIMTWQPEAVIEELERRLNASRNDDSTPSLFD